MKCPVCTSHNLLISERQGIEIDYCPQCRGVWLDRGELDKLIERSAASQAGAAIPQPVARQEAWQQARPVPAPPARYDDRFGHGGHAGHGHHGSHGNHGYEHKRRKKGFLGEIFDFD